jgi:hypothetical protein
MMTREQVFERGKSPEAMGADFLIEKGFSDPAPLDAPRPATVAGKGEDIAEAVTGKLKELPESKLLIAMRRVVDYIRGGIGPGEQRHIILCAEGGSGRFYKKFGFAVRDDVACMTVWEET